MRSSSFARSGRTALSRGISRSSSGITSRFRTSTPSRRGQFVARVSSAFGHGHKTHAVHAPHTPVRPLTHVHGNPHLVKNPALRSYYGVANKAHISFHPAQNAAQRPVRLSHSAKAGYSGTKGGGNQGSSGQRRFELGSARVEANNVALHEAYKAQLRQHMSKPHVTDPNLSHLVDPLYRSNAKIGSGSTADAIRHERVTGQPVGGAYHSQKGADAVRSLEKWLHSNPTATPGDRAAAENIILDLKNALGQ